MRWAREREPRGLTDSGESESTIDAAGADRFEADLAFFVVAGAAAARALLPLGKSLATVVACQR